MATVYVKFNSAVIKMVPLMKDEMTIGRKPGNDIVIDHPTISGFHAKIKKEADKYLVEDLNSTNGTFINGRRIKTTELKDKDQVGIAGHILDFHMDDKPAVVPAPEQHSSQPVAGVAPPISEPAQGPNQILILPEVEKQKEMLRQSLGMGADGKALTPAPAAAQAAANGDKAAAVTGVVRIIMGGVNGQSEVQLKDLVTYIGTTEQALIKIKGFLAPSLAAAISKRPDGFFLKAVKAGYPKVNGQPVQEQVFLENGALIEVGGTNMVFYRSDAKKAVTADGK